MCTYALNKSDDELVMELVWNHSQLAIGVLFVISVSALTNPLIFI